LGIAKIIAQTWAKNIRADPGWNIYEKKKRIHLDDIEKVFAFILCNRIKSSNNQRFFAFAYFFFL
jgi:hypothetical protein